MVLIGTGDVELAKRLHRIVGGRKVYAFNLDRLVELAAELKPKTILLDGRLGGLSRSAADFIPRLERADIYPAVIVLVTAPTRDEQSDLADLGAYDVIDLASPRFAFDLREALHVARWARRHGGMSVAVEALH